MAYHPRAGKTRWRHIVAELQQRNRIIIVDLERLLTGAMNAESRNALLQMIIAVQANLLDLTELAAMKGEEGEQSDKVTG